MVDKFLVPFPHFAHFMNDEAFWSRWEPQLSPDDDEKYFIENWAAAKNPEEVAIRRGLMFDFSRTNVTVLSKDDPNFEHDGEHISHFFKILAKGERL